MNEQQLQQAFIQYLALKLGVNSQEELEEAIKLMGEEGLRQAYAEFMQVVLQQLVQRAQFGAKLNYLGMLRGKCPDGYEMGYYQHGGTVCKKCMKKQVSEEMSSDPVKSFKQVRAAKCGGKTKKKKCEEGAVLELKCGGKTKKAKKYQNPAGPLPKRLPIIFDRREAQLGNGRGIISDSVIDYDNGNGQLAGDNASILGGRTIYVAPNGNDTIYWNYPEHWMLFDEGFIPIGEKARNQGKAQLNFYQQVGKTVTPPTLDATSAARRRALEEARRK